MVCDWVEILFPLEDVMSQLEQIGLDLTDYNLPYWLFELNIRSALVFTNMTDNKGKVAANKNIKASFAIIRFPASAAPFIMSVDLDDLD